MIVGVCGFGNTGSSAVSDYLKEFEDLCVLDNLEFGIICEPDGLADLAERLLRPKMRNLDSAVALLRYERKCRDFAAACRIRGGDGDRILRSLSAFLDSVTQARWYWRDRSEPQAGFVNTFLKRRLFARRIIPLAERLTGRPWTGWPRIRVGMSVMPDNFYEAACEHVRDMIEALGGSPDRTVVLDQPFGANDPRAGFPFFRDPRAIVSDRDPRDLYVFALTALRRSNSYMPLESPADFITYYRALRQHQPYLTGEGILRVRFEDMVYDYEATTARIRDFLGLGEDPRPGLWFDPARSVHNTRVFTRFPQYADAVREIEEALPEYLFDFDSYPPPEGRGPMFTGRTGRAT
ncbi:MAG: hypothetical protein IK083_04330 [Abditibacteriota bacterium]|nr:hypothetical protein [Abditibacteriota bacterium]